MELLVGRGRPIGTARPQSLPATLPEDEYDVTWMPKGAHCMTCGRPDQGELLLFRLWSVRHAKWAGSYRLCSKCWERANDRPDPDPLHVAA